MSVITFEPSSLGILPLYKFLGRLHGHFLFSLGLIPISWIDARYNACMMLRGMFPVNVTETTRAEQLSSFYAFFGGIAFLSIAAIIFAPFVYRPVHIYQLE